MTTPPAPRVLSTRKHRLTSTIFCLWFQAVAEGKPFEGCIEMIDIGGPTMVRAAAKNCDSVAM